MRQKKVIVFVYWIAAHLLMGCASYASRPHWISNLDAKYKSNRSSQINSQSTGIHFYRNVLGRTLGSTCPQFPSDSQYALRIINTCGSFRGTLLSYARFLKEQDNFKLGFARIQNPRRLLYADLDFSCSL